MTTDIMLVGGYPVDVLTSEGKVSPLGADPEYYFILPLAGQSNAMSYGEGLPLPETLDAPDPRIKQLARRATVTPSGETCQYNDLIPADHCLHDVQNMSGLNHPHADLSKGQYGCVGQGLHIAKKLLPYLPANAGILLVPCCRGGSAFTQGCDGSYNEASGASDASYRWGVGKPLYRDLVARTQAALGKNPQNVLLAMVWMQGEFDMTSARYAQQPQLFAQMVNQFRADLAGYSRQCPGFRAELVPWICGDTTYYWQETYPDPYDTVFGSYKTCTEPEVYFVSFMTDEKGHNTPTNAPTEDPDITAAGYYGSASRTGSNWTTSLRSSHFSSWARRNLIAERLATAIIRYTGRKTLLAAPSFDLCLGEKDKAAERTMLGYSPKIMTAGYNGRRGDGTLQAQGGEFISGADFIPIKNPDNKGGFVLDINKTGRTPWIIDRFSPIGADLIKFGGKLSCKFRLTTAKITNQFAFAFYWQIAPEDIPAGIAFVDSTVANTKPFVMSFLIQTDATNINLVHHRETTAKLGTFGAFNHDWHTFELVFSGKNSIRVTPQLDGSKGTTFDLANSPSTSPMNVLRLTCITANAVYRTELAAFDIQVYRDDGTITLSDADVSSYVYFPPGYNGGKVIIPDATIGVGNTIQVVAHNAGTVTLQPASNFVLLQPAGATEALPSPVCINASTTLIQTGLEGKTWRVV